MVFHLDAGDRIKAKYFLWASGNQTINFTATFSLIKKIANSQSLWDKTRKRAIKLLQLSFSTPFPLQGMCRPPKV